MHKYRLWRSDLELKLDEIEQKDPTFILLGDLDEIGVITAIKTKIFECQNMNPDTIEASEIADFLDNCDSLILSLENFMAETNKNFLEIHK